MDQKICQRFAKVPSLTKGIESEHAHKQTDQNPQDGPILRWPQMIAANATPS